MVIKGETSFDQCIDLEKVECLPDNYHLINSAHNKYRLFMRLKGILVRATNDLFINLEDQSKYLITLEEGQSSEINNNSIDISSTSCSGSEDKKSDAKLIQIIMEPID